MKWEKYWKLEAVDRMYPTFVGVATVIDLLPDGKIRIGFDGADDMQNYDTDPSSGDLHPIGYSEWRSLTLRPPPGYNNNSSDGNNFSWKSYLKLTRCQPAPYEIFNKQQKEDYVKNVPLFPSTTALPPIERPSRQEEGEEADQQGTVIEAGQKLEAIDTNFPNLLCVATVKEIIDTVKLRITYDGWPAKNDVMIEKSSETLHPIGFAQYHRINLQYPKDFIGPFTWQAYLKTTNSMPMPYSCFTPQQTKGLTKLKLKLDTEHGKAVAEFWQPNRKCEVFDSNHNIWGVATISKVTDHSLVSFKFDGWTEEEELYVPVTSTMVRPVGHAAGSYQQLRPPKDYKGLFDWLKYLVETNSTALPIQAFTEGQLADYEIWEELFDRNDVRQPIKSANDSKSRKTSSKTADDRILNSAGQPVRPQRSAACRLM